MTDTRGIASLLHRHGALSVWDYAAAAPYLDIDMAADAADPLSWKDAVVLRRTSSSAAPARRACSRSAAEPPTNTVPVVVGGGTVAYVNPAEHVYLTKTG